MKVRIDKHDGDTAIADLGPGQTLNDVLSGLALRRARKLGAKRVEVYRETPEGWTLVKLLQVQA